MASLSELNTIRSNPIKDGLDAICGFFETRCAELTNIVMSSDAGQLVLSRSTSEGITQSVKITTTLLKKISGQNATSSA